MWPVCTTTCVSLLSYLGFSLQDQLRSSATFNHILLCLSLSNLTHNQSQHIQALQQLTHASQPYNMNATQSCISNQYQWCTFSQVLSSKHIPSMSVPNMYINMYHHLYQASTSTMHQYHNKMNPHTCMPNPP
jgi:hypothetical protein